MPNFKYLFSPLRVGPVLLKNRIIFAPHVTGHFDPTTFLPTKRATPYFEERAKGGVAWIILSTASVDEKADYYPACAPAWWSDEVIPGIKEIVDKVHKYDCKFSAQISHPGTCMMPLSESGLSNPLYAPSDIAGMLATPQYIPHALEVEEILEIEEKFADAAERVKKTGCDGVEIMGVHGKLPSAFASPLLNQRDDQYGGSVENRFRFWVEVVQKVRERVGKDYLVGVRMNDQDGALGGLTVEEAVQGAQMIEATGAVDYISLCTSLMQAGGTGIVPQYPAVEPGYRAPVSAKFKAALKVPVFMAGKINDPAVADRLIANGVTDAVLICRQLIADPFFAQKTLDGKEEDIRPCVYCNQGCRERFTVAAVSGLRCQVNPAAGEEFRWGVHTFSKSAKRKKILIIGAGPGGLECARTLAERGHDVVIYEKEKEIGGQVRLLRQLPGGRDEFYTFIDWLDRQVSKLDIDINLGMEINEGNLDNILQKEKPDEIICATGARAGRDGKNVFLRMPILGHELEHVFTYEDVLNGADLGNEVLIFDTLQGRTAPGIAEILAEQGKQVKLVYPAVGLMDPLGTYNELLSVFARLGELNVKNIPYHVVLAIDKEKVTLVNVFTKKASEEKADSVVLSTHKCANNEIYKILKCKGINAHLIGDAVAPRVILNAVHDGHELALKL